MITKNYKPPRLYKILSLVDLFDCSSNIIDTSLNGVLPEFLNKQRFHFTQDSDDRSMTFESVFKLFSNKDTVIIVDVKHNSEYPMKSYKICTDISDYLLRDPHNLNIPLIILNYENQPQRCLYMCDFAITGHAKVLYPVPDNCIEVIRNRGGSTGKMLYLL